MEVPDDSQRDVVPEGDFLKGFVLGGHGLGVRYLGLDNRFTGGYEECLEWKASNHEYSTIGVVGADQWNYVRMSWCFEGIGENQRIGDDINVRGIEFSARVSVTSLVKGSMLPDGAGGFTTQETANGPMIQRIVVIVRPRGDGNSSTYTWGNTFQYDDLASPLGLQPLEEGIVCLYDRTFVLDDDGDFAYDKCFIDCDFAQSFHPAEINPWLNDIEVWYYFNEPSYGGNAMQFYLRTWFSDK